MLIRLSLVGPVIGMIFFSNFSEPERPTPTPALTRKRPIGYERPGPKSKKKKFRESLNNGAQLLEDQPESSDDHSYNAKDRTEDPAEHSYDATEQPEKSTDQPEKSTDHSYVATERPEKLTEHSKEAPDEPEKSTDELEKSTDHSDEGMHQTDDVSASTDKSTDGTEMSADHSYFMTDPLEVVKDLSPGTLDVLKPSKFG